MKHKYKYKKGTRVIETEGREPVFDKNKNLIYHNPNDPTHKEGGVDAIVVKNIKLSPKELLLHNMTSKTKIFPEGSSIVTAENNSADKALNAYRAGDKSKLSSIIKSMPKDQASKGKKNIKRYKTGTQATRGGLGYYTVSPEEMQARELKDYYDYGIDPSQEAAYNAQKFYSDQNKLLNIADARDASDFYSSQGAYYRKNQPLSNQTVTNDNIVSNNTNSNINPNLVNIGKGLSRIASIYGITAPIWKSLSLGKQQPELQQRNYLNPVSLNDNYNIQPQLDNINSTYTNQVGVVNNNVGTSQNRRALMQSIYNQKRSATNEVLANKANYISNLKNQQVLNNQSIAEKNLNLKNQYNTYDEMARAKRADMNTGVADKIGAFSGDLLNYMNKYRQDDINKKYVEEYYDTLENNDSLSKYKKSKVKSKKGKYKLKSK